MQTSDIYFIEGVVLLILSTVTLNILLNEGAKEYLNSRYTFAYKLAYLISFVFLLTWVCGTLYYFSPSLFSKYLMVISSEIFWIISIIGNIFLFRDLWINAGLRFCFKMDYLNILFYLATLWLLAFHISMSYYFLFVLSTLSSVIILYFTMLIRKYINLTSIFVVPVNVYKFFVSFTVVTAMFSLLFLARIIEISGYLFFAITIYIFLIFTLLSLIIELKPLISKA